MPPPRRECANVDLFVLAEDDPLEAIHLARIEVERAGAAGNREREVEARRALGVAERNRGRTSDALKELDHALERAGDDPRLAGLVRTSRAACWLALGKDVEWRADIDWAVDSLTGVERGIALFQRASINAGLMGYWAASADFDAAIPVLHRGGALLYEAHALNNRGAFRAFAGQFAAARSDIERARRLYLRLGNGNGAATALHNLAFVAMESGDIIGALQLFDRAREEFGVADRLAAGDGRTTVLDNLELDCCRALLAAGRATEARARALEVAASLVAHENEFELPEAHLIAAVASLQSGDLDAGRTFAAQAAKAFSRDRRRAWAAYATLVETICTPVSERSLKTAQRLSVRLMEDGLPVPAMSARMLAADVALRIGDVATARREIAEVRRPPAADLRIALCELRARIADREDDSAEFSRWIRRGLVEFSRYQSSFASSELRWSVGVHGRRLLATGSERAVRRGRLGDRFRWVELARTNALRHAPVRVPDDPVLEGLLGELRVTERQLMEDVPNPDHALERAERRRTLQRAIADRERMSPATSTIGARAVVGVGDVQRLLGDAILVQLDVVDDGLTAIRIDRRRAALIDLGPIAPVRATFRALCGDLSSLAAGGLSPRARAATIARVERRRAELDQVLTGCVGPADAGRPVVIVPPPEMHDAPWAVVPSLGATELTLAGSATTWAAAATTARHAGGRAVLVAGPELRHSWSEVGAIATSHADVAVLRRGRATARRVLRELDGAWLAHLATHHHLERDNPLFGSFTLSDGPLFMHDLLRVGQLPTIVVLAACEAGRGNAGPVGDVLSAATVMMERGTTSVIASSCLVPDDGTTGATMLELHRLLAAGTSPAPALLTLRRTAAYGDRAAELLTSAYCCFGLG